MMCINRKVSLVLMAVLALFIGYSFQYPAEIVAFPRFLLAVLLLMSILLFIRPGQMYRDATVYFDGKVVLDNGVCKI